jgi:hypothetical protein
VLVGPLLAVVVEVEAATEEGADMEAEAEVEEVAGAKEGAGPETAGSEEVVVEAGKTEEVCEIGIEGEEQEAAARRAPCFKMSSFLGRER